MCYPIDRDQLQICLQCLFKEILNKNMTILRKHQVFILQILIYYKAIILVIFDWMAVWVTQRAAGCEMADITFHNFLKKIPTRLYCKCGFCEPCEASQAHSCPEQGGGHSSGKCLMALLVQSVKCCFLGSSLQMMGISN